MKFLAILMLMPSALCGLCVEDYLNEYREIYEKKAEFYAGHRISKEHLENDRERAIFYSGCALSLQMMQLKIHRYD